MIDTIIRPQMKPKTIISFFVFISLTKFIKNFRSNLSHSKKSINIHNIFSSFNMLVCTYENMFFSTRFVNIMESKHYAIPVEYRLGLLMKYSAKLALSMHYLCYADISYNKLEIKVKEINENSHCLLGAGPIYRSFYHTPYSFFILCCFIFDPDVKFAFGVNVPFPCFLPSTKSPLYIYLLHL